MSLVLLDFGLVALSAASGAVSRVQAGAQVDTRALALASATVERILSSRCGGTAVGASRPATDIEEWWTDEPAPNGTRLVSDSLLVTTVRGRRSVVLREAARCQ